MKIREWMGKEKLLGALGLKLRPSATSVMLSSAGFFALGALVGASVGLLMAPRSGRELRRELRQRLGRDSQEEAEPRIS